MSSLIPLAKDVARLAPWGAPAGILVGWFAWPALSPAFKEETLGLKPAALPTAPVAASPKVEIFRAGGKYKYTKGEIGEAPTLEED